MLKGCISNCSFSFGTVFSGDTDHGNLTWLVSPPTSDNLKCTLKKGFIAVISITLLISIGAGGVKAQYFYQDIWNSNQIIKEMGIIKAQKIRTVTVKSFDNNGEPAEGFFCEKRIARDYTLSETITRSYVTSQSLLSSYFSPKGLIIKTVDSSEATLNITEYLYNDNDRLVEVKNFTKANDDVTEINESRTYVYNLAGQPQKMIRKKNGSEISAVSFSNDEKGNIIEEAEILKSGKSKKYFYYYDAKNNLTDVVHYNERAKRLLPDYMYEYNISGHLKQMTTIDEGGGYYIWMYTYNDLNLRETERCLSREKKLLGSIEYSYK